MREISHSYEYMARLTNEFHRAAAALNPAQEEVPRKH
jgi:hypothetical protein